MKSFFRLSDWILPASCLALSLGFPLVGCGTSEEPEVTREEFCARWAEAACSPEVVSVCQASDHEDCRYAQRRECLEKLPSDFVDRGVDACIRAVGRAYEDADLTASELDIVERFGAPCNDIFLSGHGGDECEVDADCEPWLRCVLKDEEEGTCQVPVLVQAGFPCRGADEMCEDGFFCDGRNCIATLDEGDSCENGTQCGSDMFCDGVCFERGRVGTDCADDAECLSGICYEASDDRTCVDRLRLSPAEPMCRSFR